jgi:hypothetical protein
MGNRNGQKAPTQDFLGLEGLVPMEAELGDGGSRRRVDRLVEDVGETPQELMVRPLRTIDRHVLLGAEPEDPQIISTVDVIGVKVGDPDRIDMIDAFPNQLKAKLGRRVHQEIPFRQGKHRTVARPAIPWVL